MMITEEIVHIKGHPKKLIIFLHGYIDCAESIDHKLAPLCDNIDNFAIHIPQAPQICEIHQNKRQWYSMHRFDPDDIRKRVPTVEECVAVYDTMALGLQEAYDVVAPYIEQTLSEYGLGYEDIYLCGFSQGAMVALYTALLFPEKLGGVISFSGILAGQSRIAAQIKSRPDVLLIHGNKDNLVRFSSQRYTSELLSGLGCDVESSVIENEGHIVTEQALSVAVSFIRRREKVKETV